jgi:hypothetical protein
MKSILSLLLAFLAITAASYATTTQEAIEYSGVLINGVCYEGFVLIDYVNNQWCESRRVCGSNACFEDLGCQKITSSTVFPSGNRYPTWTLTNGDVVWEVGSGLGGTYGIPDANSCRAYTSNSSSSYRIVKAGWAFN